MVNINNSFFDFLIAIFLITNKLFDTR